MGQHSCRRPLVTRERAGEGPLKSYLFLIATGSGQSESCGSGTRGKPRGHKRVVPPSPHPPKGGAFKPKLNRYQTIKRTFSFYLWELSTAFLQNLAPGHSRRLWVNQIVQTAPRSSTGDQLVDHLATIWRSTTKTSEKTML